MKIKRIISIIIVSMLCISFNVSAIGVDILSTQESVPILPRWSNTSSIECALSFSGKTATCSAKVVGYSGSTINSTMTLYKKNGTSWNYVTSWTKNSTIQTVTHSQTYTVSSSGTYKLVIDATVSLNGTGEPVSKSNEAVCS